MKSICVLFALVALTRLANDSMLTPREEPPLQTGASVIGTYGLGVRAPPSLSRDGCWLEAAPVATDSIRVQVRCTTPPAHHIGVIDERLRLHDGTVVYETRQFGAECRVTVRFSGAEAVVTQEGSDQACGFGAFVNVGGTYRRISSRRPPFDLFPIERRR